jgi:DNA-binding MarR family transcriptional regulator
MVQRITINLDMGVVKSITDFCFFERKSEEVAEHIGKSIRQVRYYLDQMEYRGLIEKITDLSDTRRVIYKTVNNNGRGTNKKIR